VSFALFRTLNSDPLMMLWTLFTKL